MARRLPPNFSRQGLTNQKLVLRSTNPTAVTLKCLETLLRGPPVHPDASRIGKSWSATCARSGRSRQRTGFNPELFSLSHHSITLCRDLLTRNRPTPLTYSGDFQVSIASLIPHNSRAERSSRCTNVAAYHPTHPASASPSIDCKMSHKEEAIEMQEKGHPMEDDERSDPAEPILPTTEKAPEPPKAALHPAVYVAYVPRMPFLSAHAQLTLSSSEHGSHSLPAPFCSTNTSFPPLSFTTVSRTKHLTRYDMMNAVANGLAQQQSSSQHGISPLPQS